MSQYVKKCPNCSQFYEPRIRFCTDCGCDLTHERVMTVTTYSNVKKEDNSYMALSGIALVFVSFFFGFTFVLRFFPAAVGVIIAIVDYIQNKDLRKINYDLYAILLGSLCIIVSLLEFYM